MKLKTLLLLTSAGLCISAQADEKEIDPSALPAAVKAAIAKAYPKAEVEEALVHTKKGVTTYEAELEIGDDQELELTFDAKGKILMVEEEIDTEDLPANIIAAVTKAFPEAELEDAEIITTGGVKTYEVEVCTKDDKEVDVTLSLEGKILKTENEEDEDEDSGHNKKSA